MLIVPVTSIDIVKRVCTGEYPRFILPGGNSAPHIEQDCAWCRGGIISIHSARAMLLAFRSGGVNDSIRNLDQRELASETCSLRRTRIVARHHQSFIEI